MEDRMIDVRRVATVILSGVLLWGCVDGTTPAGPVALRSPEQVVTAASFPTNVTVRFGVDERGSPFPAPAEHDASGHARDHVYPKEVVIARGGSVTFEIDAVHQVAVYEPGVDPSDIEVAPATLEDVDLGPFVLPNFRINDPTDRIVLGPPQQLFEQEWTTPAGTFDAPGRYLVICTTVPHFVASKMWAWVTVK
jgi:hypothetical protein